MQILPLRSCRHPMPAPRSYDVIYVCPISYSNISNGFNNYSSFIHQMGCYDLALADAVKSTEIKPDWAKGYFRKGAALQALGRHEEAFQSFYECLTLEDEKAAKQVHTETT